MPDLRPMSIDEVRRMADGMIEACQRGRPALRDGDIVAAITFVLASIALQEKRSVDDLMASLAHGTKLAAMLLTIETIAEMKRGESHGTP